MLGYSGPIPTLDAWLFRLHLDIGCLVIPATSRHWMLGYSGYIPTLDAWLFRLHLDMLGHPPS